MLRRRLSLLAPGLALLAALLVVSPVLSALRIGTAGNDTLVGTDGADLFTGRAGNDLMKGLAGNDVYYFDDESGTDTVIEKPGEGSDTLSFAKVNTGFVIIALIRQWGPGWNTAAGSFGGAVHLGTSVVENATAGSDASSPPDEIYGGAEKNTLQPGGGIYDYLNDYGGWKPVGSDSRVALPASNDTYKGFGRHGGTVFVTDFGGTGDVLDLRPFAVGDVYVDAVNLDSGDNTTEESLQIVTGDSTQVLVRGHFSSFVPYAPNNQKGQIEKIIFADGTFSGSGVVGAAAGASVSAAGAGSVSAAGDDLEQVAKKLLAEALRAQHQYMREGPRQGGGGVEPAPGDSGNKGKDKSDEPKKPDKHAKKTKKHDKRR